MDRDHFEMAYEHYYWRVARLVDAMMDVYPDMERRLATFANLYNFNGMWQHHFVKWIFQMDDNLVWCLLRHQDSLEHTKIHAEIWMDKIASINDSWMFN